MTNEMKSLTMGGKTYNSFVDTTARKQVNSVDEEICDGYTGYLSDCSFWEQGSYSGSSGALQNSASRIRMKWPVHLPEGAKLVAYPNGQYVAANILERVAETGDFDTDFKYVKLAYNWTQNETTFCSTSDDIWIHLSVAKETSKTGAAILPEELAATFRLYDSYAFREINKADFSKLQYGPNCVTTIAHRGDVVTAPENTISAYREAVKKGYENMETDVHFTSDGIPVMLHDDTIDRTSDGTGNVSDFTLAELRELDFGSWKSAEYAGEKIPTFEEMLAFSRATGIVPWIELKGQTQTQVETLVNLVRDYGMIDAVHWVSFEIACLGYVAGVHTDANLCWVHRNLTDADAETMSEYKTEKNKVGILCYNTATAEKAAMCKAHGLYMMAGTITTADAVLTLPSYVSHVVSNDVNATKILFDNAMGY